MKISLTCVSLIMLFTGCVSSDSIELPESNESESSDSYSEYVNSYEDNFNRSGCDTYRSAFIEKTINGVSYTFEVPVMCDHSPYLDKGDPYIQNKSDLEEDYLDIESESNELFI